MKTPKGIYPPMQMIQTDTYQAMVDVLRDIEKITNDRISRTLLNRVRLVVFALEHPRPLQVTDPPSNTGGAGPWSRRRVTIDET